MLFSVTVFSSLAVAMNGVTLQNAANPGVKMPLCGLGTGGYGNGVYQKLGTYCTLKLVLFILSFLPPIQSEESRQSFAQRIFTVHKYKGNVRLNKNTNLHALNFIHDITPHHFSLNHYVHFKIISSIWPFIRGISRVLDGHAPGCQWEHSTPWRGLLRRSEERHPHLASNRR